MSAHWAIRGAIRKLYSKEPIKDLIDFVIYRPDVLYDKLRKDIVEPGPELDKIKKIKKRLKNDFDRALFYARPSAVELSVSSQISAILLRSKKSHSLSKFRSEFGQKRTRTVYYEVYYAPRSLRKRQSYTAGA